MNHDFSLTDLVPLHWNSKNKSKTLYWNGTDQQDHYTYNLQFKQTRTVLEKLGWIDSQIEYRYNSHGFRNTEFDNRTCAIALGCSFTEGTGLHATQTWPSYLSTMLDLHVWNLGSPGASIDTVFRILDYYILRLNPKYVFILIPLESRLEYCNSQGDFVIMNPSDSAPFENFFNAWATQPFNGLHNTRKTLLAIEKICHDLEIPLFAYKVSEANNFKYPLDFARDLMHRGPVYQKRIAEIMYRQYTDKKEFYNE